METLTTLKTTADLPVGSKVAVNFTGEPNGATVYTIVEHTATGFKFRTIEGHSGRTLRMIREHAHLALANVVYFDFEGWRHMPNLSARRARRAAVTPLGFPGFRI